VRAEETREAPTVHITQTSVKVCLEDSHRPSEFRFTLGSVYEGCQALHRARQADYSGARTPGEGRQPRRRLDSRSLLSAPRADCLLASRFESFSLLPSRRFLTQTSTLIAPGRSFLVDIQRYTKHPRSSAPLVRDRDHDHVSPHRARPPLPLLQPSSPLPLAQLSIA